MKDKIPSYKDLQNEILELKKELSAKNKLEDSLQETNELLSLFIKQSPIHAFIKEVTEKESKVIFASENYIEMIGITGSEMKGKNMHELFPPEFAQKFTDDDWEAVKNDVNLKLAEDFNGKNYTTYKFPISIGNKKLLAGYTIEITELRKKEQELIIFSDKLKEAQKIAQLGNWEHDYILDKLIWSSEIYSMIDCEPNEFEPSYDIIIDHIYPDDREKTIFEYEKSLETKQGYEIEYRIITKNGTLKYIKEKCKTNFDEAGNPLISFGIVIDITNQKISELKLKELTEELYQLNKDKDRFISILAHDLKSPFNALLGYTELLSQNLRDYDINEIEHEINIIREVTIKTFNLLEDMLIWAKNKTKTMSFEPKLLNFSKVLNDIYTELEYTSKNKNIKINYLQKEEILIFADKNMLRTILRNLISNAIKFTKKRGEINISAQKSDKDILICVSDNGIGIDTQNLTKLFDITQKSSTLGTDNESGTGLGLFICKDFIEKHNGKIWVESVIGKGSDFKFTIPII